MSLTNFMKRHVRYRIPLRLAWYARWFAFYSNCVDDAKYRRRNCKQINILFNESEFTSLMWKATAAYLVKLPFPQTFLAHSRRIRQQRQHAIRVSSARDLKAQCKLFLNWPAVNFTTNTAVDTNIRDTSISLVGVLKFLKQSSPRHI